MVRARLAPNRQNRGHMGHHVTAPAHNKGPRFKTHGNAPSVKRAGFECVRTRQWLYGSYICDRGPGLSLGLDRAPTQNKCNSNKIKPIHMLRTIGGHTSWEALPKSLPLA
jgi:hypothetical protein